MTTRRRLAHACRCPDSILAIFLAWQIGWVYYITLPMKQTFMKTPCEAIFNFLDSSLYDETNYIKAWTLEQSTARALRHATSNISINTDHVARCRALWTGDKTATDLVSKDKSNRHRVKLKTVSDYLRETDNCTAYVVQGGFRQATLTREEVDFPLAFSLLVYTEAEQVERLLRAIYRPQNVYCLHVDSKADFRFRNIVQLMARCLPNVFLASPSIDVQWGQFSVLLPELLCLRLLWQHPVRWRYFINLTGQEFPLKTNRELVRILKAFKGANDIAGARSLAYAYRWMLRPPAPFNISVASGSVHIAASRQYVDYILHDHVAQTLLRWVCPTFIPDETFFPTLNYNTDLRVPGSCTANLTDINVKTFARHKIWTYDDPELCSGTFVRMICHFGVGDLPRLVASPQLFANKFSYEYQPAAYDCLELWYQDKVQRENRGRPVSLNLSVYEQSDLVRYRYKG